MPSALRSVITLTAAGKALGVSNVWIKKLIDGGYLKKSGKGVTERDAWRGYVAFLKDDQRRASKTASASRVQDSRARQIDLKVAEHENRVVDAVEVRDLFVETFGTLKSGLGSVPARVTPDLALRHKIETEINDVLRRAADSFEQAARNPAPAGGAAEADSGDDA